ncbi:hypothetical protein BKA63DRAFT_112281 [Paraphoma chrysanthemicola]|nr:hypothetical protein BKA63DRAFT_112281 [Paraphoma chrysanthemicola]
MSRFLQLSRHAVAFSFLILLPFVQQALAANILSDAVLSIQRDCVQWCFGGYTYIWKAVGCPQDDTCMCRPDLRGAASSRLSSCILTEWKTCSDGTDIAIATSIFNRYCSFTGPATVFVTPTPTAGGGSNGGPVTVTVPATGPAVRTVFTSAPTVTVLTRPQSSGTSPRVANPPTDWLLGFAIMTTALSVLALRAWV